MLPKNNTKKVPLQQLTDYNISLSQAVGFFCTKATGKNGEQLIIGNPSQSYGASPAIWDDAVLAATRHR